MKNINDSELVMLFANLYRYCMIGNDVQIISNLLEIKHELEKRLQINQNIVFLLENIIHFIHSGDYKPEVTKIIKLSLLTPETLDIFLKCLTKTDTVSKTWLILQTLSDDDYNMKNLIISKLTEYNQIDNILHPNICNVDIFLSLIQISSQKTHNIFYLLDSILISKTFKIVEKHSPNQLKNYLNTFLMVIPLNRGNINSLNSSSFPKTLLKHISTNEIDIDQYIEIFDKLIGCHMSHKLFVEIIKKSYFQIHNNKYDLLNFVIRIINKVCNKNSEPFWTFFNLNNNKLIIDKIDSKLFKSGITICFDVYFYSIKTVDPLKISMIHVSGINTQYGVIFTVDSLSKKISAHLTENNIITTSAISIGVLFDLYMNILIAIRFEAKKIQIIISTEMESHIIEFELEEVVEMKKTIRITFGKSDIKIGINDKITSIEGFNGEISGINILNYYGTFNDLSQKIPSFENVANIVDSSLCFSSFNPIESGCNASGIDSEPCMSYCDVTMSKNLNIHYHFNNFGGCILLIFFYDKISQQIKNESREPSDCEINIIENIFAYIFTNFQNPTKYRGINTCKPYIVYEVLHYVLFANNSIGFTMNKRILDIFTANIEMVKTSTDTECNWKFCIHFLLSPILWNELGFEIQTIRMQLIFNLIAANYSENQVCIPIINIISYMHSLVKSNTLESTQVQSLMESVFRIYQYILQQKLHSQSLMIFCDYFTTNNIEILDELAFKLIGKLFSTLDSSDCSIVSAFYHKIMLSFAPKMTELTIICISNIITKPLYDSIVSESNFRGWISKLIIGLHANEKYLFDFLQSIIAIYALSKISQILFNRLTEILSHSLLLLSRISIKNRLIIIRKILKLFQSNPEVLKKFTTIDDFIVISSVFSWKSIPSSIIATIPKIVVTSQSDASFELEFNPDKVEDSVIGITIIQQVAQLHLIMYRHHTEKFNFLISPLLIHELYSPSATLFPVWQVKITFLSIYLRHFYSLDHQKNIKDQSEYDIILRVVESAAYILIEIASTDLHQLRDQEIDSIDECINYLGLTIKKHLSFLPNHFPIPLIITLRFINFGSFQIIKAFMNALDRCIQLFEPTLFHLCAVVAVFYTVSLKIKDDNILQIMHLNTRSIVENYSHMFEKAGLGVGVQHTPESYNSFDFNTISIKLSTGYISFDDSVWRQIVVLAEEHPLIVGWLSNPTQVVETLRQYVSNHFTLFIEKLEFDNDSFFNTDFPNTSYNFRINSHLRTSTLFHFTEAALVYNIFISNLKSTLETLTIPSNYTYLLGSLYSPILYPYPHPPISSLHSSSSSTCMKYYCLADYFEYIWSTESLRDAPSIQDFNSYCNLIYLGHEFYGYIHVSSLNISFNEYDGTPISTSFDPISLFLINLQIPLSHILHVYIQKDNTANIEMLTKSGSSFYFRFEKSDFTENLTKIFSSLRIKVIVYSDETADVISKYCINRLTSSSYKLKYLLMLNRINNRSFHTRDHQVILPHPAEKYDDSGICSIYFHFFKNYQPIASLTKTNANIEIQSNLDPFQDLNEFYKFFTSESITNNIDTFTTLNFSNESIEFSDLTQELVNIDEKYHSNLTNHNSLASTSDLTINESIISQEDTICSALIRKKFNIQNIIAIDAFPLVASDSTILYVAILTFESVYIYSYNLNPQTSLVTNIIYSVIWFNNNQYDFCLITQFTLPFRLSRLNLIPFKLFVNYTDSMSASGYTTASVYIAVGGCANNYAVLLNNDKKCVYFKYHQNKISCIDLIFTSSILFTGDTDGLICMWKFDPSFTLSSYELGKHLNSFVGHTSEIRSFSICIQLQTLSSVDRELNLHIHSYKTLILIAVIKLDFVSPITSLYLRSSPYSQIVVVSSDNNSSMLFSSDSFGSHQAKHMIPFNVTSFWISKSCLILVADHTEVRIYKNCDYKLETVLYQFIYDSSIDAILGHFNINKIVIQTGNSIEILQFPRHIFQ